MEQSHEYMPAVFPLYIQIKRVGDKQSLSQI